MSEDREEFKLQGQGADELGIECPRCGCRHFEVTHVWRHPDEIKRRKKCRNCGRPVTTIERRMLPVSLDGNSAANSIDLHFHPETADE